MIKVAVCGLGRTGSEVIRAIRDSDRFSLTAAFCRPGSEKAPWLADSPGMGHAPSLGGFRLGQQVVHPKFGAGVIVTGDGSGSEVRLQINFAEHGLKWLDLRYAKLETVD